MKSPDLVPVAARPMIRVLAAFVLCVVLASGAIVLAPPPSHAGEPEEAILEHYSIVPGADIYGVRTELLDRFFGRGSARSKLTLEGPLALEDPDATGTLSLRVWRRVPAGTITFALLVFRIEVRGYDAEGALIYSRDPRGFVFGDSASGDWSRTLANIPAHLQRIDVTFFGNYE